MPLAAMSPDAPGTLTLPDMSAWHAADRARVRKAVGLGERNARIRDEYRRLRAAGVPKWDAIAQTAAGLTFRDEAGNPYRLGEDAINAALWPRGKRAA